MTVNERMSLCRFLEKIEEQETYCASIGVRDVSRFRGKEAAQTSRRGEGTENGRNATMLLEEERR